MSSVTTAKLWDGTAYTTETGSYYEIVDSRYVEYPKAGQETSATYGYWPWPCGVEKNVKLTYVAGYDSTGWDTAAVTAAFAVPEDLELAVATLAAHIWRMKEAALGVAAESFGPRSITYRDGDQIPSEIRAMLEPYCRVEF